MTPSTVNGLDNSIALRYDEGISYGAVDWIRGSRIKIQASARLKPGQVLDFRMELTGRPEAPYGLMQVTEILPSTDGGAPHIIGTLLRMDTEDLAWLNQWLTEKRPGGQLAQMDASAESKHALQTPAASEALQQYIDHRGRLEPQANILRAPFAMAYQETPFDGRSDYGPFICTGMPAGGLFTGAEQAKSEYEETLYGGIAGDAYDACYHQNCDTIENLDLDMLDDMAGAASDATMRLAFLEGPLAGGTFAKPAADGPPRRPQLDWVPSSCSGHERIWRR